MAQVPLMEVYEICFYMPGKNHLGILCLRSKSWKNITAYVSQKQAYTDLWWTELGNYAELKSAQECKISSVLLEDLPETVLFHKR